MTTFNDRTMLSNYIRLLSYIDIQIDTDAIDYAMGGFDTMKNNIKYYIEHIDDHYKWELVNLIPLWIIKEKILDVPFGFGDPTCEKDVQLYHKIKCDLYHEMWYRENRCKCDTIDTTKFYRCWQCQVRDCGCKADPTCCGEY